MIKIVLLLFLIATTGQVNFGQDPNPPDSSQNQPSTARLRQFEIFAGYSAQLADLEDDNNASFARNIQDDLNVQNGFNVSATAYLTPLIGVTGDFSAHFRSNNVLRRATSPVFTEPEVDVRSLTYLVGPQVRVPLSQRAIPFARVMLGAQTNRLEFKARTTAGGRFNISDTFTDFAIAIGGGIDVPISNRFKIRALQVDYIPVFTRDRNNFLGTFERLEGRTQNNVRFSFGIVF